MHVDWSCIRLNGSPSIKLVKLVRLVGAGLSLGFCLVIGGSTGGSFFLQDSSGVVSQPNGLRVSQYVVSVESLSMAHYRVGGKTKALFLICWFPVLIH